MGRLNRILLVCIAVLLPLIVIVGAVDLTARMPDFYQYEFNKNNTSSHIGLNIKNDELAQTFSDFMLGRSPALVLETEYMGEEAANVFLEQEQNAMARLRLILNGLTLVAVVLLVGVLFAYYRLICDEVKKPLRRAFFLSVLLLMIYEALLAALLLLPPAETMTTIFFGESFSKDGLFIQIFNRSFLKDGLIASMGLAAIGQLILGMVTWSLTKPYRMFGPTKRT